MSSNELRHGETAVDITVLVTGHREGPLLAPALRSAHAAMRRAEAEGCRCELVLVLDKPDDVTSSVAEQCLAASDRVLSTDVGNAGMARNYGIADAQGRTIALLDGDDLFGNEWLFRAFAWLQKNGSSDICLHPACTMVFGAEKLVWRHIGMEHPDYRLRFNVFENYFTALCFAPKEVYTRVPFRPDAFHLGFGHEDFAWVRETIHCGIRHLVVPETLHVVRRKRSSRLIKSRSEQHLTIPTPLFSGRDIRLC